MLTFVGDNIVYTGHAGQFAIPRLACHVTEYRPRPIPATAAGWIILALDNTAPACLCSVTDCILMSV
jgi:hypothetical protein